MNQQADQGANSAQSNNGNSNNNGNPAWQEYLKDVPEALQPLVRGAFERWDANVTQRFQQLQQQIAPLKAYAPLVQNNVPPERVALALQFAEELEKDPSAMVNRINTTFGLQPDPVQQVQQPDPFSYEDPSIQMDISKHPQFQQMQQMMQQMQAKFDADEEQRKYEEESQQFVEYLDNLVADKPHLNNDDAKLLITGFMSQGLSEEDALARVGPLYLNQTAQTVTQQLTQQSTPDGQQPLTTGTNDGLADYLRNQQGGSSSQAPVVMGGAGTVGSGTPQSSINFGAMKTDDINSMVADLMKADNQQD